MTRSMSSSDKKTLEARIRRLELITYVLVAVHLPQITELLQVVGKASLVGINLILSIHT